MSSPSDSGSSHVFPCHNFCRLSTGTVGLQRAPCHGLSCEQHVWVLFILQERGMSGLLSSDEHWAKAQAATEEARRQAKIVEAGARRYTCSLLELFVCRL